MPHAFCAGFKTANRYESYWNNDEAKVIQWARDKASRFEGYVFAHNGGKFDFPAYLLKHAGKEIRGEKALLINGRLVKMRLGRAEIRDSYAILPSPLSAFDKGDIDYTKLRRDRRDKHRDEILRYLKRDCDSLHTLVLEFVVQNGIKSATAAGAAMASLKELCNEVDSLTKEQDTAFRKFYYGGRVQVFHPGVAHGKFTTLDIKSAYPHAMKFPHSISNEFQFIAKPKFVKDTDFVSCVGYARGCFPVRNDKTKGLDYPHADRVYNVTGHEYNTAISLGLFDGKVLWVERPLRVGHFTEYVDFHYKSKIQAEKDGNDALRLIYKILINSGYGKFAQDPENWREYMFMSDTDVIPEDNPEGWEEETCDEDAGFAIWSRPSQATATYYNVSTAASITGFVRARIMQATHAVKVYYCDTDSITIDSADASKIKTGSELGDWSYEDETDMLAMAGKKLYGRRLTIPEAEKKQKKGIDRRGSFQWHKNRLWKIATKGCRLTPSELLKVCDGKTVTYRSEAPTLSVKSEFKFLERRIRRTV